MGDSAGGGLALGLAHALHNESVPQPKQLVLLSPWLDVTMSHPEIPKYEDADPILSSWGLKRVGELWAYSADNTNHIYVSPKMVRSLIYHQLLYLLGHERFLS